MLEQKWEMVRWLTRFLEENKEKWEELREVRQKNEEARLESEAWEKKTQAEKENQFKVETESTTLNRDEKIKRAKEKRKCWTD